MYGLCEHLSSFEKIKAGIHLQLSIFIYLQLMLFIPIFSGCTLIEMPAEVSEFELLGVPVETCIDGVCTGNLDEDADDEIVYISPEAAFVCFADVHMDSLSSLYSIRLIEKIPIRGIEGTIRPVCSDLDGDGIDEVFLGFTENGEHVVHAYSPGEIQPVYRTEPIPADDGNGDGKIEARSQTFVIEGFSPEHGRVVVTSIMTGFDLEPRGMYFFSSVSGELLWSFETAGWPTDRSTMIVRDVDGDGFVEVITGISSVGNGHRANGMKDDRSYVVCISGVRRDSLWVVEASGPNFASWTYAIQDVDSDGSYEIFIPKISKKNDEIVTIARIYKASDGELMASDTIPDLTGFGESNVDVSDIVTDIPLVLSGKNGAVYEFTLSGKNLGFREIRDAMIPCVGHSHHWQLWGDPVPEIVYGGSNGLIAFNRSFSRLITYHNPDSWNQQIQPLGSIDIKNKKALLISELSQEDVSRIFLLGIPESSGPDYRPFFYDMFPPALLCTGCGGMLTLIVIVFRSRKSSDRSDTGKWERIARQLMLLWAKGLSGPDAGSTGSRDRSGISINGFDYDKNVIREAVLAVIRSGYAPVGGNKELRIALDELVSRLNGNNGVEDDESNCLNAIQNKIFEITVNGLATDPICCARRALRSRSEMLTGAGVILSSFTFEGSFGSPVLISASDLQWIIEELIDNAVSAMRDSDEKCIALKLIRGCDRLLIQVRDTGEGIPSSRWEEIFEIGKTGKGGGNHGYGLFRARKLLRSWGGDLKVLFSEPGVGTSIQCRLMVAGEPAAREGGRL